MNQLDNTNELNIEVIVYICVVKQILTNYKYVLMVITSSRRALINSAVVRNVAFTSMYPSFTMIVTIYNMTYIYFILTIIISSSFLL